jgi:hypothetical protein
MVAGNTDGEFGTFQTTTAQRRHLGTLVYPTLLAGKATLESQGFPPHCNTLYSCQIHEPVAGGVIARSLAAVLDRLSSPTLISCIMQGAWEYVHV